MKKLLSLVVLTAGLLFAADVQAQVKIGYVRIDDIVGVMPELAPNKINIDTVGQQYVKDSILPGLNYAQSQYNQKLGEYSDTIKNPPQVRAIILKELESLKEELDDAQNLIQQAMQYKQSEFLRPYYAKAKKAIEAVAKKKGYTHIMSSDNFLVAPEADDISLAVLAELNIKLPDANKPAGK